MRAILGCVLGLLLCCALTAEDKKDEKIDAKKLVGKWRLKDDKEGAMVMEFGKDGTLTTTVTFDGKELKKTAVSYRVEGNALRVTDKVGGKEEAGKTAILKLTDTEMVFRKENSKDDITLVRIKDK
jgi:uncharacterized protein (TIGR03066 family)